MGLIFAALLSVFLLFTNYHGVYPNPVTGKKEIRLLSEDEESALGGAVYFPMQEEGGGQADVPKWVSDYVTDLGKKMAAVSDRPDLPFEFVILQNPEANAWCLPGGKIAVNTGMLQSVQSEGQLAYILGHEVTHAAARHDARMLEKDVLTLGGYELCQPINALFAAYNTQKLEREADIGGLKYLQKAGYDPKASLQVIDIFSMLSGPKKGNGGFFASHPSNKERRALAEKGLANLPQGGKENSQEFIAMKQEIAKSFVG